jgi:lambda family phage portal protein
MARRALTRAYEAAAPGDRWRPRRGNASANADHQADAAIIRAKARALVQNVPYIAAALRGLVAATVGTGIVPRATGAQADRINKLLREWGPVCDADGRLDYAGVIAAAYRTMEQDGEVLIRLRPRSASDGLPVPLQLQLLEIDWLDSVRTSTAGQSGNRVVNGIEYDALGRVAAYWLWDTHPGDVGLQKSLRAQSRRVPAENIIHLYSPDRPGQGRGFSRFAPIIARVRDLQLYEDAEIARKNLETRLGVLYSGDPEALSNAGEVDAAPDTAGGHLGDLPSGSITRLPVGSNVTVVEPTVAPGHTDYVKYQLHVILAGIGVPYEMATGDMRETNFSSARVRQIDFRREVEQVQWLCLVPSLLNRIHRAFIDAAVLAGKLRQANYGCDYSMPRWSYVDPEKEVAADRAEIAAGLSSISEKLRSRGYDPATVFAEIEAESNDLKARGVLDLLLFKETGKPPPWLQAQPTAQAQATADAGARAQQQLADLLVRMDARLQAMEQRSPEVHVHQAATTVHVPATTVNVEAARHEVHVHQEPTTVHVPPTTVNVEAARHEVHVAAPEVRFEVPVPAVHVSVPPRKTITTIERDAERRMTRTVSTDEIIAPAAKPPASAGTKKD